MKDLSDLQIVDLAVESHPVILPPLFEEIQSRGLYKIVNGLEGTLDERKAIAHSRMVQAGYKCAELKKASARIHNIKMLQQEIARLDAADLNQIKQMAEWLLSTATIF